MVHGWNGRGAQLGAFAPELVRVGFRVVTFDTPAHGRSAVLGVLDELRPCGWRVTELGQV